MNVTILPWMNLYLSLVLSAQEKSLKLIVIFHARFCVITCTIPSFADSISVTTIVCMSIVFSLVRHWDSLQNSLKMFIIILLWQAGIVIGKSRGSSANLSSIERAGLQGWIKPSLGRLDSRGISLMKPIVKLSFSDI